MIDDYDDDNDDGGGSDAVVVHPTPGRPGRERNGVE